MAIKPNAKQKDKAMIDSLAIAIAILTIHVARPVVERNVRIVAPVQVASIQIVRKNEVASEMFTTCYEVRNGSCWSEN